MSTKRPIVAIRPIIDGRRRGVRESLEEQTMQMAKTAAALISENLKYTDGTPVQTIVADRTIDRTGEPQKAHEQFSPFNVCAELTATPCRDYVTEVIDMNPAVQHAVWDPNATERPGAVTLAAAMAACAQFDIPAFGIHDEHVQDADDIRAPEEVREKILRFYRAAITTGEMHNRNYLQTGSQCMGIAESMVDRQFMCDYLGMGVESVDMIEMDRRITQGIFDPDEYAKVRAWVKDKLHKGEDIVNHKPEYALSPEEMEAQWDYVTKTVPIGRDLVEGNPKLADLEFHEEAIGHNVIVAGFQGRCQWTDYKSNGDLLETFANTTFNWNDPREPLTLATENDVLNGTTTLFNHLLTNRTQVLSDVRTSWSPEAVKRVTGCELEGKAAAGSLDLRNSGATTPDATGAMQGENGKLVMKEWWKVTERDIQVALDATTFHPSNKECSRGGGFSTHFVTRGDMPLTTVRINLVVHSLPVIQLVEGWSMEIPDKTREIIENRTDPAWSMTFFIPRLTSRYPFDSTYNAMDAWGANHGAIGYGHSGADLITLAAILRIPVMMHNLSAGQIYRPRSWNVFGTDNLESADYRACEAYDALYRQFLELVVADVLAINMGSSAIRAFLGHWNTTENELNL